MTQLEWISKFFDDLTDLDKADWDVIHSWSWGNRADDVDRKRRKQAELLMHESFCWDWLDSIGVIDSDTKKRVEHLAQPLSQTAARGPSVYRAS